MADVNYMEYGENAVRVLDSGEDFTEFANQNGDVIGVFIAFLIIMFFVALILVMLFKFVPKIINAVQGK